VTDCIVPDSLAATRDTLREAARDHDDPDERRRIGRRGGSRKPAVEAEGRLACGRSR
jgi:molybdopterin molybdotransferase